MRVAASMTRHFLCTVAVHSSVTCSQSHVQAEMKNGDLVSFVNLFILHTIATHSSVTCSQSHVQAEGPVHTERLCLRL